MATRFYLRNSAQTTGISPTPDAGWEDTSALVRAIASTNKSGDAIATVTFTDADATAKDILFRQYVSPPLTPGQTITGAQAVSFVVRASEVNANNNLFTALGIRILASDGTTVQKTVLAVTQDNTEIVLTTLTNRNLTATSAATNYTTVAGDRLVIEIGYGGDPSGLNTHSGSLSLGDNAGSDLTANDTGTAANNPWVELADTLTFQQYTASGGATSGGAAAIATGKVFPKASDGATSGGTAATATGKVIAKASLTITGQTPAVKIVTRITPAAASLTTTRSTPIAKTVLRPVQASGGDGNAYQNYQTTKGNGITSISLDWNYGIPKIGHVYAVITSQSTNADYSETLSDNAGNAWDGVLYNGVGDNYSLSLMRCTSTLSAGSTWTVTYNVSASQNLMLGVVDLGPAALSSFAVSGAASVSGSASATIPHRTYGRAAVFNFAWIKKTANSLFTSYPSGNVYLSDTGATDLVGFQWGIDGSTAPFANITRSWTLNNGGTRWYYDVAGIGFGIGAEPQTPTITTSLYPAAASLTLSGETPDVTTGGGGATDYAYSASGGITSGGVATTSATSAYAYSASGGITSGGAATTSASAGYAYSAFGGATSGGAATTAATSAYTYDASGGITSGGAATTATTAAYTYSADGGATSGGAATTTTEAAYAYAATGGATSGGAATTEAEYHYAYDASGGATSGGAASTEYSAAGATTYEYNASGGVTSGGAADTATTAAYAYTATGGVTSGGAADTAATAAYAYNATGGATAGGTATTAAEYAYAYSAAGGATAGGSAGTARTSAYAYSAAGGATAGGSATTSQADTYTYAATGGVTSGGGATVAYVQVRSYTATGGATASGTAAVVRVKVYPASGGATSGGAALTGVVDIPGSVSVAAVEVGTASTATAQAGAVDVSVAVVGGVVSNVTAGSVASSTQQVGRVEVSIT